MTTNAAKMVSIIIITTVLILGRVSVLNAIGPGYVPPDYLGWNYTYVNENCTGPDNGRDSCEDIRVCNFAFAAIRMGGWPTMCGWVGKGVPKVCCGLPLVLGKELMRVVNEEKARNRECGQKSFSRDLSETENKFFEIYLELPPVDTSDPNTFDPPLVLNKKIRTAVFPVGGRPSRQGDFPWMVAIDRGSSFWCGGTLIDRVHVLSAAHCFVTESEGPDASKYTVRIGNIYVDRGHPFSVSKIIIHDGYDPKLHYNDIAILRLDSEILIPQIAHICLPDPNMVARNLTGEPTTLLGWGDTEYGGSRTPVLHIVDDIPVVSNEECNNAYRRVRSRSLPRGITNDFICAGLPEGGKDACQQDSGGPLMYTNNRGFSWTLVGIVSFGVFCGEPGIPGVYTRVSSYTDWIELSTKMPPQQV